MWLHLVQSWGGFAKSSPHTQALKRDHLGPTILFANNWHQSSGCKDLILLIWYSIIPTRFSHTYRSDGSLPPKILSLPPKICVQCRVVQPILIRLVPNPFSSVPHPDGTETGSRRREFVEWLHPFDFARNAITRRNLVKIVKQKR
jgi:hypothetical protein